MFKLSIIVPADGLQEDLDNTLVTVLENRPGGCQVIVPHSSDYKDPYGLSDEVTFVSSESGDLAALINSAVEVCESEIVHVLLSGTLAGEGWIESVLDRFGSEPELSALAPAILNPDQPGRLSSAGICYGRGGVKRYVSAGRKRDSRQKHPPKVDGPALQAMFIRRAVLNELGGFRADFGSYHLDSDLAARLQASGHICVHHGLSQVVGRTPTAPRGFQAARRAERLYWCHRQAAGRIGHLPCHVMHTAADILRQIPWPSSLAAVLGRASGMAESAVWPVSHVPSAKEEELETVSMSIKDARHEAASKKKDGMPAGRYSRSA